MTAASNLAPADLQTRADANLVRLRRELAYHIQARMDAEGLGLLEVAQQTGTSKNMIFRLMKVDDPKYDDVSQVEMVNLVIAWLELTWGDLDPPADRSSSLGDFYTLIARTDWPLPFRLVLREVITSIWRAFGGTA